MVHRSSVYSARGRYAISLGALVLMAASLPVTFALLPRQLETVGVLVPSDEIEIRNEDALSSLVQVDKHRGDMLARISTLGAGVSAVTNEGDSGNAIAGSTAQIAGQLVDPAGKPLNVSGAFVFLCDTKTGFPIVAATKPLGMSMVDGFDKLWHAVTDDRGSFEFDDVARGNYKLIAQSWPGTNEIPTMNGEPSTTVRLHGVVQNIKVDGNNPVQTQIRPLGEGVLKIVNDPQEAHAFLFLSRAAMIGDPILGPLGWGKDFISNMIGVTLMEDVHVTIEGLPDKKDVHVAIFNYDNNPGIGSGRYRVGQQKEVRLKIYATWSNGRYDPPDHLLKLVEYFEKTDTSLSKLIGLERSDINNNKELFRIAGETPARKVEIDDLGTFRFIDVLAATRYKWLRDHHPALRKARMPPP
jgi:hypothetical protein